MPKTGTNIIDKEDTIGGKVRANEIQITLAKPETKIPLYKMANTSKLNPDVEKVN